MNPTIVPINRSAPPEIKDHTLVGYVGRGEWTDVYSYRNNDTGGTYVYKFLNPSTLARKQMQERGWDENYIWRNECLGGNTNALPGLAYGSLERAVDGTRCYREEPIDQFLSDYLERRNVGVTEAIDIAKGLAQGLRSLHLDLGRAHSDLHPKNIGYTTKKEVKISDFGASTLGDHQRKNVGSSLVRAPERFMENEIHFASDVWSYGANLFKLFTDKYFLEEELQKAENPGDVVRALYLTPERWNKLVDEKLKDAKIPFAFRKHLKNCLGHEDSRIVDGGELVQDLESTVKKYEHSKPKARALRWGLVAAGLAAVIGSGLLFEHNYAKQTALETKVEQTVEDLDLQKKMRYARVFQEGSPFSSVPDEMIELGCLNTYETIYGDKRLAILAYLDVNSLEIAISRVEDKNDVKKIYEQFIEVSGGRYLNTGDIIYPAPDGTTFLMRQDKRQRVLEEWKHQFPERLDSIVKQLKKEYSDIEKTCRLNAQTLDSETYSRCSTLGLRISELTGKYPE